MFLKTLNNFFNSMKTSLPDRISGKKSMSSYGLEAAHPRQASKNKENKNESKRDNLSASLEPASPPTPVPSSDRRAADVRR